MPDHNMFKNFNFIKQLLLPSLLGFGAAVLSMALPLGLCAAPILFAFMGAAWGYLSLGIGLGQACLGIFIIAADQGWDTAYILGLIALFLPSSVILCCFLKQGRSYRSAAGLCAVCTGLALYALLCLPFILEGESPFEYFEAVAASFGEQLTAFAQAEGFAGDALEAVERFAAYARLTAPDAAVMTIVCTAMAMSFTSLLITRALCRAAGVRLRPMAPFHKWQLSRDFVSGCLVLLLGAFVVILLELENASAIAAAVQCIVGGPYALMGVCLLAFGRRQKLRSGAFFTFSIVLLALMLPYSIYGLSFMGAFDRIFKLRERGARP